MIDDKFFLGRNGFIWFNGVVEDRLDPQYLGRVRVRCIGFHTANKTELPTADLPWAMPALPVTSAGISGLGFSPAALVEGSWVFGYFRDGQACQEPIVIGSLPGYPIELANSKKGFFRKPAPKLPYFISFGRIGAGFFISFPQLTSCICATHHGTPTIDSCTSFFSHHFVDAGLYQPVFGHCHLDSRAAQKLPKRPRSRNHCGTDSQPP
jgi:hypothetical protein